MLRDGVHWHRRVHLAPNPFFAESNVMSQNNPHTPSQDVAPEVPAPIAEGAVTPATVPTEGPTANLPEDESTIGTGTSMALGCIAGTVVLIVFGLLFLALSRLV